VKAAHRITGQLWREPRAAVQTDGTWVISYELTQISTANRHADAACRIRATEVMGHGDVAAIAARSKAYRFGMYTNLAVWCDGLMSCIDADGHNTAIRLTDVTHVEPASIGG
jgi:hypothetical protein